MTDAQDFLERVQSFAEGPVADAAPAWTMGQPLDAPVAAALAARAAEVGLTGLSIPAAFGGQGHRFGTLMAACEAVASVDFGYAMSLVNTHNVGLRLCLSAPDAVRDAYLPGLLSGSVSACTALTEPGVGSDFGAITSRAIEIGNGWRLTGEKTWIVNGRHAGLAMVFAQCGDHGDAGGIGGFLVDLNQPGVRRYPIESGFSQVSMGTGGFVLDDVVAVAALLPPGKAFKSILTEINAARSYVAGMCNAMLGVAIAQASDYGTRRISFGKPLDAHPTWRQPLVRAQTDLAATRTLTAQAVSQIEAGEDAQLAAAQAKIAAVDAAQRHIPQMLHAVGAAGLLPEYCFTRHLAAAQIAGLTDGANSILQDRVARLTRASFDNSKR